jgi:23S rRNA (guanine745-N1)-methyltransferase
MSIDSTWLRCPNCSRPLTELDGRVLGCEAGHRFDISKHETVTLLPPGAPRTVGDTREMLDARAELLGSGVYEPIATAIGEACATAAHAGTGPLKIVDLGCGTGYYSAHLAAAFPGTASLVADRSPIAVRIASRAVPDATGVVLDLWRPLPIRDAIADVSINVFAPRNPDEFARITRRGGSLVVVVPTDRHLRELRAHGGMLEIPSGKADQVSERFAQVGFDLDEHRRIEYIVSLDEAQARSLVGMGPSAHHIADLADDVAVSPAGRLEAPPTSDSRTDATVSVDVLHFRRT